MIGTIVSDQIFQIGIVGIEAQAGDIGQRRYIQNGTTTRCTTAAFVDAKTGIVIYLVMAGVSPVTNGGTSNPMETPVYPSAYSRSILPLFGRIGKRHGRATRNSLTAFAFAIGHWPISLLYCSILNG